MKTKRELVTPELYRGNHRNEFHWHHVGPAHERGAFNLIDLVGYAPAGNDRPPFHLYNVYQWNGPKIVSPEYKTIPAAKRAGRKWVIKWLPECHGKPVEFEQCETGVHFIARVNHLLIANYYYCPKATAHYPAGFRAWFRGTYYLTDFSNPVAAEQAIAATWVKWLAVATANLLPEESPHA